MLVAEKAVISIMQAMILIVRFVECKKFFLLVIGNVAVAVSVAGATAGGETLKSS